MRCLELRKKVCGSANTPYEVVVLAGNGSTATG